MGATKSQGVLPEFVASAVNSSGVVLSVLVRLICCIVMQLVVPAVPVVPVAPVDPVVPVAPVVPVEPVAPVAPVVPVVPLAPAAHWETFTTPKPAGRLMLNCGVLLTSTITGI